MNRVFCRAILIVMILCVGKTAPAHAYENEECLDCHGDSQLVRVVASGQLEPVCVDPKAWEKDVHQQKGIKCVDCHSQASPRFHPREGFVTADCSRCHPEDAEQFHITIHAKNAGLTQEPLPQCQDCHTSHAVLPKEDRESTVHQSNIKETCRHCHPEIMPSGLLNRLATFRISGHRKENVGKTFNMEVCILCHQESAAHGPPRLYNGECNDCHKPRLKEAMLGIHLIPALKEQPVTYALKFFDGALVLVIVIFVAAALVCRYREKILLAIKGREKEE